MITNILYVESGEISLSQTGSIHKYLNDFILQFKEITLYLQSIQLQYGEVQTARKNT